MQKPDQIWKSPRNVSAFEKNKIGEKKSELNQI